MCRTKQIGLDVSKKAKIGLDLRQVEKLTLKRVQPTSYIQSQSNSLMIGYVDIMQPLKIPEKPFQQNENRFWKPSQSMCRFQPSQYNIIFWSKRGLYDMLDCVMGLSCNNVTKGCSIPLSLMIQPVLGHNWPKNDPIKPLDDQ